MNNELAIVGYFLR